MKSVTIDPIVIVGGRRTACGAFMGELSTLTAPQLGAVAITAALKQAGLQGKDVSEVIMGNVLSAGIGQGPARQAGRQADIPDHIGATTINKLCGSGLKAVMLAHDMLKAGSASVMVAGGMESMSNAPYIIQDARAGLRMGHTQTLDHMFLDGLEDAETGQLMGIFAQNMADKKALSREAMDEFAISSLTRAQTAQKKGYFQDEIVPCKIQHQKQGLIIMTEDEQPKKANLEKIPILRPAFNRESGTITAANSSSISDGAAALVLMTESEAIKRSCQPLAQIIAHTSTAVHPSEFSIAPCGAIESVLHTVGWSVADVDLFEINEAFAMVAMMPMITLGIQHEQVNIYGGACALGHPIGATGARLIVTLMSALRQKGLKKGIASLCIGGGEAVAMAIEMY